jgi:hypothetical protein
MIPVTDNGSRIILRGLGVRLGRRQAAFDVVADGSGDEKESDDVNLHRINASSINPNLFSCRVVDSQ